MSIVEQQKNVEWDALLQAIFLYLWDNVVEKAVLVNGVFNSNFGVILPHNRKKSLFLRALGSSE